MGILFSSNGEMFLYLEWGPEWVIQSNNAHCQPTLDRALQKQAVSHTYFLVKDTGYVLDRLGVDIFNNDKGQIYLIYRKIITHEHRDKTPQQNIGRLNPPINKKNKR